MSGCVCVCARQIISRDLLRTFMPMRIEQQHPFSRAQFGASAAHCDPSAR